LSSFIKLVNIIFELQYNKPTFTNEWLEIFRPRVLCSIRTDYRDGRIYREHSNHVLSDVGVALRNLLEDTVAHFTATLPHDYIYGLLGLLPSGCLPYPLAPDYGKPFPKVYQEYTRFIIEHTSTLSVLFRQYKALTGWLPTWVPDFRFQATSVLEPTATSQHIFFSEDGNRMKISGVRLGICTHRFVPLPRNRSMSDSMLFEAIQHLDQFIRNASTLKRLSVDEVLEE
jgi:hypothetical protein